MPKLLAALTMRQRLTLGAAALGVVLVAFLLLRVATAPSYTPLLSGVDPAETNDVTQALDAQGIPYKLENNGTAVAVEQGDSARARVALASQGLGGSGGAGKPGYELLDEQKLGASDFQQKVSYQRALEGEIAKTVGQIPGAGDAKVQLTLPEDELFSDEAKAATAAVMLGSSGGALDEGQVRGIASLVASSVEGLKPDKVTITDGAGQMLWPSPSSGGAGGGGGGANPKAAAESRYNAELEASLNGMLARTLGAGKAQVMVRSDLDVDETSQERLRYDRRGTPARVTEEDERLRGTGAGVGGTAGAVPNIDGSRGAQGAGGRSNYRKRSEATDFLVGKEVTRTKRAPGAVNRLDVALLVDETVPMGAMTGLEDAVGRAAGVQADRGDEITVTRLAFADGGATGETGLVQGALSYAKWAALGLGLLLLLAFVARALRRREDAPLGEPTWLREIEVPRPIAALEAMPQAATFELPPPPVSPQRQQVEDLVADEPERVAQQLREWLEEDQR